MKFEFYSLELKIFKSYNPLYSILRYKLTAKLKFRLIFSLWSWSTLVSRVWLTLIIVSRLLSVVGLGRLLEGAGGVTTKYRQISENVHLKCKLIVKLRKKYWILQRKVRLNWNIIQNLNYMKLKTKHVTMNNNINCTSMLLSSTPSLIHALLQSH